MSNTKFRAWDYRNNEMVHSENTDCFYINTKGVLFMYAIPNIEGGVTTYHKSYDVDQFSGTFDLHSNEIYSNDICLVEGLGYCRVGLCQYYGVVFYSIDGQEVPMIDCMAENDSFVVSGNVHSTPELLEELSK